MNLFKSVWFWLLLIGLIFVIIGTLITGACVDMNGWSWMFLIVGFVLILVGIALGLLTLMKNKVVNELEVKKNGSCERTISPTFTDFKYSRHPYTPHSPYISPALTSAGLSSVASIPSASPASPALSSPALSSPASPALSSPTSIPSASPAFIVSDSPIVPTQVTTNIPQAQRGFNTSAIELSALSP